MRVTEAIRMRCKMFIGGEWVSASSGKTFAAVSPATGEVIGEIPEGTRDDARRAVLSARQAQETFGRISVFDRAAICHAIADSLEGHKRELAELLSLEQGKPLRGEAIPEVEEAIGDFRSAAEDVKRLETSVLPAAGRGKRILTVRQPKGVYAIITPWNWPLSISAQYLAPCLAAGNTAVLVPAPTTSVCVLKLAECIDDAGLPPGTVNVVTGPGAVVGDEIAGHSNTAAVAFTGSSATGKAVAARAAGKSLLLELGGNGPLIVLADADLAAAAEATVSACFLNAGQSCSAAERILVHESVAVPFMNELMPRVLRLCLGDPFDARTTIGPLNNEAVAAKTDAHIRDAVEHGAAVMCGGSRANGFPTRLFYPPTVLSGVTPTMLIFREETFGPVAPITTFSSDDEAIELANRSSYGLLMAVFTKTLSNAFYFADRLEAGVVNVNESSNYWEPHTPFGGKAGKESGFGRVGGRSTLLEMTDLKTIVINTD